MSEEAWTAANAFVSGGLGLERDLTCARLRICKHGLHTRAKGVRDRLMASMLAFGLFLAIGADSRVSADPSPVKAEDNRTVVSSVNGRTTVRIAPPDNKGLSHNRYSRFDVPETGVDLDNRRAEAQTILNEVVSSRRSQLNGPLTVLGKKAHVIIANPNGITVDGASFRNIGGLVLATGAWSGSTTRQLKISGGDILVTGRGLAATMSRVHLLSRKLRIRAAIDAGKQHGLELEAGKGVASVHSDTAADLPDGLITSNQSRAADNEYLVTIEQGANLRGGAIRITVNAAGAGVRVSGDMDAFTGGIWISANGDVNVEDARVKAREHVFVAGDTISLKSTSRHTEIESSLSGIKIDATGRITVAGVSLRGAKKVPLGFDSLGAVSMRAGKTITVTAASGYTSRLSGSEDGVVLTAKGDILVDATEMNSADLIRVIGGKTTTFSNGTAKAVKNIHLEAENGALSLIGEEMTAEDSILLNGMALSVRSNDLRRTIIKAVNGGILGTFTGDIVNDGGLIQGSSKVRGEPSSRGGVTLITDGKLTNRTLAIDRIGSIYSQKEDLYIEAPGGVENFSGRLLSEADIYLKAQNGLLNEAWREAPYTKRMKKGVFRLLGTTSREHFYGKLLIGKEIGQIKAAGNLTVTARNLRNIGSEIAGGDVDMNISEIAENISVALGGAVMKRRCFLLFCSYSGASNVHTETASILATGKLTMKAGKMWRDIGGSITATQGIEIASPNIRFEPLFWEEYYSRASGFSGLFMGRWGRLFTNYQSGTLRTSRGEIRLTGHGAPIILNALEVDEESLQLTGGEVIRSNKPTGLRRKNELRIDLWPFSKF